MVGFITIVINILKSFIYIKAEIKIFQIKNEFFFNDKLYHDCYKHLKILHPILEEKYKYFK